MACKLKCADSERHQALALLLRAQDGDRAVLPELRETLDGSPRLVEIYGDLARNAQRAFVDMLAGKDLVVQEAAMRKVDQIRSQVAGPCPSPLEAILADRIALCWVHMQYADSMFVQNLAKGDASYRLLSYLQDRQDRCHRRLLSAVRALAQVRRLLRPSVAQVNITTGDQMNVAEVGPPSVRD